MYKFYNANALNKYEDDCVIRAISCATGKSWDEVYDILSNIAQYEGTLLDKREFVIKYLDRMYQRLKGVYGTIGEVSGKYSTSTLLITTVGHIVCSKNGVVYDTFDPRNKQVEYVWLVK
jgi:hypothetical protein